MLLGKAILFEVLANSEGHSTVSYSKAKRNRINQYNSLSVGLRDHLLNIAPLFDPDRFADAFFAKFRFPCYFTNQ